MNLKESLRIVQLSVFVVLVCSDKSDVTQWKQKHDMATLSPITVFSTSKKRYS